VISFACEMYEWTVMPQNVLAR